MSQNRKFQGVWIPADVWLDRSLSTTEKVMLVEISSLQDESRGCFATNAYFAEFFALSNSRVSEIISGLAAKNFIEVELIREGKQIVERRIWMKIPAGGTPFGNPNTPSGNPHTPSGKAATPFGKDGDPSSEKAKGNNTKINNTNEDKDLGGSESVADAFDLFWQASYKNGSKKKARELFAAYCKRTKTEPMAFAMILVNDTNARKKAGQFGFDKLHITTYLNQERWNDRVAEESGKPGAIHHNFQDQTYQSTPKDQIADFLRDDE